MFRIQDRKDIIEISQKVSGLVATATCVFTIVIVLSPARLVCPARKAVTVGPLKRGVGRAE